MFCPIIVVHMKLLLKDYLACSPECNFVISMNYNVAWWEWCHIIIASLKGASIIISHDIIICIWDNNPNLSWTQFFPSELQIDHFWYQNELPNVFHFMTYRINEVSCKHLNTGDISDCRVKTWPLPSYIFQVSMEQVTCGKLQELQKSSNLFRRMQLPWGGDVVLCTSSQPRQRRSRDTSLWRSSSDDQSTAPSATSSYGGY